MNDTKESLKNNAQNMNILFERNKQLSINQDPLRSMILGGLISLIFVMLFSYSNSVFGNGKTIATTEEKSHASNKISERLRQLETGYSQIKSVGFAWTTMQPLLDNARNAVNNKNVALALDSLLKLEQQIEQATIQYKNSKTSIDN